MNYCLVENGAVVEGPRTLPKNWKNISNLNVLPDPTLAALGWFPVVETKPDYDPRIQSRSGPVLTVEADQVTAVWTVADRPLDEVKAELVRVVKQEAGAAILATYPDWKQCNMIARAVELARIARTMTLSAEEDTEELALQTAWDWVVGVRSASDAKEADINAATTVAGALTAYEGV